MCEVKLNLLSLTLGLTDIQYSKWQLQKNKLIVLSFDMSLTKIRDPTQKNARAHVQSQADF